MNRQLTGYSYYKIIMIRVDKTSMLILNSLHEGLSHQWLRKTRHPYKDLGSFCATTVKLLRINKP